MKKIFYSICLIFFLTGLGWAHEENAVKTDILAKTSMSWDGTDLPEYAKGKPEITILKIKIPPKTKLPLHKHPVINAGVLLKGTLTVVTEENEKLQLNAGDSIIEVVNKWHYGINEGNEFAEIIVFYAGVQDSPITVKK
ncbi:cupin domain-containing protein [Desulfobacter sp.]|uniref:cupin domain-containing protein n=1 Tax=Desulfobacter sp. TaxID=2294 RepID=UPI003D138220